MLKTNFAAKLALCLLLVYGVVLPLGTTAKAQYTVDSNTLALWHLDETNSSNVTPDATRINNGTLAGMPPPVLVEGKFGKALNFGGQDFVYVPISEGLNFQTEFTLEAWINVKAFRGNTHNNILVKCTRSGPDWEDVSRICGLAVKAGVPENGNIIPQGSLGGFVFTDEGGFNEIVTSAPLISPNQWYHVVFTRSLATGLQIYVNGAEANTTPIFGVQNPSGSIISGTEVYIGHDSEVIIDEVRISNLALEPDVPSFWTNWVFWILVLSVVLLLVGGFYSFRKRKLKETNTSRAISAKIS